MKKLLSIALALCLTLTATAALAAGKLNVVQEDFHVVGTSYVYGHAYAKVENSGDKPIKINSGVLEIYDGDGNPITSVDYMNAYARYLAPGEYTYVRMSSDIAEGQAANVSDYMMTLAGKSDNSTHDLRLPVETAISLGEGDKWYTRNYIYATVTNNTENPLYSISVVLAVLDAEGKIVYIDDDSLYSDRALMPGSSMIIRKDISTSFMDYFAANNIVPTTVDAIAYVEIEKE
ncbi:MAG: FxLYD domain-containing protein [Eubacteriales bacterium]|nr:FxLYD domain-containing protein [Eubacteriales bacterium]MDD3882159.1 FxLYD domain-containing protein [Eubacteriales bacterium]MDD4513264.1 FxLYD domain-containing protein [Eubacteriales bacterium]